MKGPLGQLMRQAQQVQDNIKRAQDEVAKLEATGESGAGMVRVTLDGKHQARKVEIAPAALQEDKEFLEDLIAAAINDASQKIDAISKDKMAAATGGMQLPPGLNLGL
ncbi:MULTISPECIES: YbaB/EbfC family nucleoid-associated protein [Hydrocarboniphaga]|jgi:DNA-binding YbaB/EbfC family protein|uniref:Nucleoid-associated protein WQQ_32020 n=2 Tax=Hydrocarboniphaga effusa TaxID=243629 RepID=I8T6R3_9GAMM|nr:MULTISPECIES: YbaB/EbfC family nucleoid-associated protein [Hydrocarboniphaga]EIT69620.1 putative cytoplasmic protein [Hydrocarboniphaga effusa AP103]MDZ4080069.1 YbaB/EbfC family nucleoid-associated protein [Hydrocarboniphaga sp.]